MNRTFCIYALLTICAIMVGTLIQPVISHAATGSPVLPLLFFGTVSLFETRTLIDIVSQMKRPKSFLLDTFFPGTKTFDTENVDIDIYKGKRRMAPFVAPNLAGKVVERLGFSTSSYKPPYVKPKMVTTAADILNRPAGITLYPGGITLEQRAAQQVGLDLAELDDMIIRREEWMAAQVLNAGTVVVQGDGVDDTIDFQMDSTHKITISVAGDKWSATTADPVRDLGTWARLCQKDSGITPNVCVMGSSAAAAFIARVGSNTAQLSSIKVTLGQINPQALPNGATFIGTVIAPGVNVDVYSYDEWYVDDAGAEQPMVPVDKVWLGSSNAKNLRLYGAIKDLSALAAMPRFPKSWETPDPSARFIMVQSAPLIALNQPDAFISADVL